MKKFPQTQPNITFSDIDTIHITNHLEMMRVVHERQVTRLLRSHVPCFLSWFSKLFFHGSFSGRYIEGSRSFNHWNNSSSSKMDFDARIVCLSILHENGKFHKTKNRLNSFGFHLKDSGFLIHFNETINETILLRKCN